MKIDTEKICKICNREIEPDESFARKGDKLFHVTCYIKESSKEVL